MFIKSMIIWVDPDFVNYDGTPESGAEIYGTCFRVHPENLEQVQEGLSMTVGFVPEVVYKQPERMYEAPSNSAE